LFLSPLSSWLVIASITFLFLIGISKSYWSFVAIFVTHAGGQSLTLGQSHIAEYYFTLAQIALQPGSWTSRCRFSLDLQLISISASACKDHCLASHSIGVDMPRMSYTFTQSHFLFTYWWNSRSTCVFEALAESSLQHLYVFLALSSWHGRLSASCTQGN